MLQEFPIYSQLVTERGDVVAQARIEAERVRRELEAALRPLTTLTRSPHGPSGTGVGLGW
ncbi:MULTISPECIES: hypothetical protein [unclassified Streptomyces]|uniref:hypothetical protein n=1 Tax=unclassified Streptomyces TaxID=2593676 RepID=UPI0021C8EC35|nr:hypothetical protein [Streptomyces sp. FIT100]UUN28757.1 hypothetical protein KK483_22015 [Streptomyces sp. FIT100]